MTRNLLFHRTNDDAATFANDNLAPSLPLPTLENTLDKYFESIRPFGTAKELEKSKKIIDDFKNGVGKKLQNVLLEKAKVEKNWVERWWENYAYLTDRNPIYPSAAMAQPLLIESVNVEVSPEYNLKSIARNLYHGLEFWQLLRKENLKPGSNKDGSIIFSSYLFRRFYNSVRLPGEQMDKIETYFKTEKEGETPTHFVVIGKGRMFQFDALNESDGSILSPQQLLIILQNIRSTIDEADEKYPVPILTCDNRTNWAKNRKYLKELSVHNEKVLDIIEKSLIVVSLDENEPSNWSEIALQTLAGDFHSRWADKSSVFVGFRNGKQGYIGEHSCVDGTISITYSTFILLSLLESPDIDWNAPITKPIKLPSTELKFQIDSYLEKEILRVQTHVDVELKHCLIVSTTPFLEYGKEYLKSLRLHPDAFIQMILQLTYFKMHKEFVATYETALMRNYYNGRTETVRSCTTDSINWVNSFLSETDTNEKKFNLLKKAVNTHHRLMDEARKGQGIDRHLFGLWCASFEANLPTPELYDDVLYKKSGGGGNFVLSTSTLGFTINNGYVAPMCLDGYGVFYSITNDNIWTNVTAYRKSSKTSCHKFDEIFKETLNEVKCMIDSIAIPKL